MCWPGLPYVPPIINTTELTKALGCLGVTLTGLDYTLELACQCGAQWSLGADLGPFPLPDTWWQCWRCRDAREGPHQPVQRTLGATLRSPCVRAAAWSCTGTTETRLARGRATPDHRRHEPAHVPRVSLTR
jgi:hypothetical protein